MFVTVPQQPVNIGEYLPMLSPGLANELSAVADRLRGRRILHLNSTAEGGGVAEILRSMTPLMSSLGLSTDWVVINPPPSFFQVTKKVHNLLQGAEGELSSEEKETYLGNIRQVAEQMRLDGLDADVWFLHDPQLLPLARFLRKSRGGAWFWVVHIDLTTPNQSVLDSLLPLTAEYDGLAFSLESYIPPSLDGSPPIFITPPAIDPLSVKNLYLDTAEASRIVAAMGIDPARPLVTQVSRFDYWKDPWGVIDAYRLARRDIPGLQLALLGLSQASDDPEALEVLNNVTEYAELDPDIHMYYSCEGLPATIDSIVNAFQTASRVILQKSTREGFGLTVTEAMWKGKPVIGGNVGGIRVQIEDGVSGYLVDTPEQCASRISELMRESQLMSRIGQAAQDSVRQRFLLPRLALDYLKIADKTLGGGTYANGRRGAQGLLST